MNISPSFIPRALGLLLGAVLLAGLTGCYSEGYSTTYRDRPIGYDDRTTVAYEDDYDYYPGHEVYYARNHQEYIYRDGNRWVRAPQPRGVSSQVLFSSPSVRVEFRDSPERHHDNVIRRYPRDWRHDDRHHDHDRDGYRRREWRDDNRNGINDYDERGYRR